MRRYLTWLMSCQLAIGKRLASYLRSILETRQAYSAAKSLFTILPKPRLNLFTDCDRIRRAASLLFIVSLGIHAVFCRLNSTPPPQWHSTTATSHITADMLALPSQRTNTPDEDIISVQ